MSASVIAHCDWSTDRSKRWMAVAISHSGGWVVSTPEPVGHDATLIERLRKRATAGGSTLVGFDFPIGLPHRYGKQTGFSSFRNSLANFGRGDWSRWFDVAEHKNEITLYRPFYPMRPGGTARQHLFQALGSEDGRDLLRLCELETSERQAACMLFWTLGGNQVGKAAIAGWREIIIPNLSQIGLWPFDGKLVDALSSHATVIAETYPGDVYGQIGIPRWPRWSKRRQAGRQSVAPHLIRWIESHPNVDGLSLIPLIEDGFGTDKSGEDKFDATVGLFGMLDVIMGYRPEGVPHDADVNTWEGWILGQKPIDRL